MANMGADSLQHNLANPAKEFLWEVMFTNPIGGGNSDILDVRCQSAGIPGRGVGEILVPYKGTPGIKFPGKLTMSHSWTVRFIEGTDKKVFDALHAWQQTIINDRTGIGGPDAIVKADIYLKCQDQQGNTWLTIKLIGCYIQDVDPVPLSYDATGSVHYSVTFSFDRWEEV